MASLATVPSHVVPASARRTSRLRTARATRVTTRAARSESADTPIPSRRDALLAAAALACTSTLPSVASTQVASEVLSLASTPTITEEAFFDLAIDGEYFGKVVVGVYGDVNKIAAARFLALANGVQGLGYKRTQIDAVEYDEDPDTGVDTPSFLGSTGIRAFVIPGSTTPVTTLPGGASVDALFPELENKLISHDSKPKGIVSLVVERGAPPPPPKEKLVSINGKFVKVADPPPPGPNGTAFTVTVNSGTGAILDRTNVVVGEVTQGQDILDQIASLPTVKDNSASPFFAVAKQIGDKRATVAEQAFGKPFAKVTVLKCGVVGKYAKSDETSSEVAQETPVAVSK